MVFGQKGTDQILNSDISAKTREELMNSKVYTEDGVISFEIQDSTFINDNKKLVEIKIAN